MDPWGHGAVTGMHVAMAYHHVVCACASWKVDGPRPSRSCSSGEGMIKARFRVGLARHFAGQSVYTPTSIMQTGQRPATETYVREVVACPREAFCLIMRHTTG